MATNLQIDDKLIAQERFPLPSFHGNVDVDHVFRHRRLGMNQDLARPLTILAQLDASDLVEVLRQGGADNGNEARRKTASNLFILSAKCSGMPRSSLIVEKGKPDRALQSAPVTAKPVS